MIPRRSVQFLLGVYNKRRLTTSSVINHPPELLDDLVRRGFIHDVTRRDHLRVSLQTTQGVYAGIDPTASSLHVGHLIPLMCLLHFHLRGHRVIPLIGGATGRVGDPSGRSVERQLADVEQVENNVQCLQKSVRSFFSRAVAYAETRHGAVQEERFLPVVESNLKWHSQLTMLDFLQSVGIHARVNTMLNRESVRARLSSQQGLSFTEFTYQLLQAYDFYHLYKHHNCSIQVGGSDQWGNILAGLELIGRLDDGPSAPATSHTGAYGITTPLLTTSSGEKFGKSAGNAIWLNPDQTSVFDFYQYFLKVSDADVERYLNLFTLMTSQDIQNVMGVHVDHPEKRVAQRRLAAEVTEMVHTPEGLVNAETLTGLFFESDYAGLKVKDILLALKDDPRLVLVSEEEMRATPIYKLASRHGLASSNSAARALVASRGLYVNDIVVCDIQTHIPIEHLIDGRVAIMRAGKDKICILILETS
ncbi:uncharacterized protein LACBIDRAFT_246777 [Laccaria bicolor S238N-H82]|uniref:Tyrosine--tRNA ligase n=1 Tax=Laccaria bicolor (strain S238N-H82 / ATCC MYA-4686) TaxID=486041 RepID=B0D0L5_LACBS|nr:uncharacterized protein LACBIDRAFT_246777 [Laccaria bicolor S238N-H82]EDR11845.1 predicted protein [Laccaria bicolor S238N-H82]|eukprot:XP_001877742.1 predicted protein [Laccaria bicolor S238N-H82]